MDDFEEFAKGLTGPSVEEPKPVTSGAGQDEFSKFVQGIGAPSARPAPEASAGGEELGLLGTFTGGVKRGIAQIKAIPSAVAGLSHGLAGEPERAAKALKEAKETLDEAGESQWDLSKVHSPGDFGYWLTEKMGEATPAMLAAAATGGAGGIAANVLGKSLLERSILSEGGVEALTWAGSVLPVEGFNTALMSAQEAQKQFAMTGGLPAPKTALAAGAAEGALQTLVPMQISKYLLSPSSKFASTLLGGGFKVGTEMSATGIAQELVSRAATKYANPNFDFFSELGPSLVEAGAAGFFTGAIGGAPFAAAHARALRRTIDPETGQPYQKPGSREAVDTSQFAGPPEIPREGEPLGIEGPVSQARRAVIPSEAEDVVARNLPRNGRDDALGIRGQIEPHLEKMGERERALDQHDASVDRYVERLPNGKLDNQILTDTEIEKQNVIKRPQGQKPEFLKVDPGSLTPSAMTALVNDLPQPGSERIWFLPTVSPERRVALLADYNRMYATYAGREALASGPQAINFEAAFRPFYNQMVNAGLRVLPSRGASFYYESGAPIVATPVEHPVSTGRSVEVGYWDPTRRILTPLREAIGRHSEDTSLPGNSAFLPVSLDLRRIAPDEIKRNADGTIELLREPKPGELLPGTAQPSGGETLREGLVTTRPTFREKTSVGVAEVNDQLRALDIKVAATLVEPGIRKILKSLGIARSVDIHISDNSPEAVRIQSAGAYLEWGTIVLKPDRIHKLVEGLGTDVKDLTTHILMHELGHFVTYHYYSRLPVEIQDQLHYAFNKAIYDFRIDPNSKRTTTSGSLLPKAMDTRYYLTLTEWLAEQFRRWATSDKLPVGHLEETFKGLAGRQEQFFKAWEKEFGTKRALDMSRPDFFFSGFMDYLRGLGDQREAVRQLIKGRALYDIGADVGETPTSLAIAQHVRRAVESMADMVPEPVRILLNENLRPDIVPGKILLAATGAQARWLRHANLIELAVAALREESAFDHSRTLVAHEVVHIYKDLGLFTPQEERLLYRDIDAGPDPAGPRVRAAIEKQVYDYYGNTKTPEARDAIVRQLYREEQLAYYLQDYADTRLARSIEAKGVFDRIIEFMQRIGNFLRGGGFQTRQDVIRAFFKGEMTHREGRMIEEHDNFVRHSVREEVFLSGGDVRLADRITRVGDYEVAVVENVNKKVKMNVAYNFRDPQTGIQAGTIELERRGSQGYEITWMNVDRRSDPRLAKIMLDHAEKDLGARLKLPAQLSEEGFKAAMALQRMRRAPDVSDLYQKTIVGSSIWYVSPSWVEKQFRVWLNAVKSETVRINLGWDIMGRALTQEEALRGLTKYKVMRDRLPKNVRKDPRMDQMFNLRRENERDEVQGSLIREGVRDEEAKLGETLGVNGPREDMWGSQLSKTQTLSQIANAKRYGRPVSEAAPDQMFSLGIRKIWDWASGVGNIPTVDPYLKNQRHEVDRIGHFTKLWWTLNQMTARNSGPENPIQIRNYQQHYDQMEMLHRRWLKRADDTARDVWEPVKGQKDGPARMEAIAQGLFDLSEMNYRLPVEVANKITRLPSNWDDFVNGVAPPRGGELDRLLKAAKVKPEDYKVIQQVARDFRDFLADAEWTLERRLIRTLKSPTQLAAARLKLKAEMSELRQKPYFPMVRFGEFTITSRDPNDNKVTGHWAYETQRQRDSAVPKIARQQLGDDITVGRVAPSSHEFMSLPGPLLRAIKEALFDKTGKTPEQIALIDKQLIDMEEFEMLNMPDRTFRKRWMPSKSLPGYSTDAFRAYSHYFMSGSRYLARLEFQDQMQSEIRALNRTVTRGALGNTAKRQMLVQYLQNHFNYIMEPGYDSGKLRAIASLWFLGFSPVAAVTNLMQVPQVFIPAIGGHFGAFQAYRTLGRVLDGIKATAGIATGDPRFTIAREEMQRQGRIDIGQAPELGAFAEGYNLLKLLSGTGAEKFWRQTSYYGMLMFQKAEQFNREVSFKTSWDLANEAMRQGRKIKRLEDIGIERPIEVNELMARLGLSHNEAVALLFSREMIDNTQFIYNKGQDPGFMRTPMMKNFLIFFKYTQAMTYAFRFNPGMIHFLLVNASLFGLMGLPFAEDINETLSAVAKKFFGQDWDLGHKVREYVRALTQGTIFDYAGPDIALHGISRFGFGLGLLPNGFFAPRFDASANGSVGRVVPGLADAMHSLANDNKTKDMIADATQKMSGAGFGLAFSLLNYLTESPGTPDSKKWEALLPRFLHGMAKAYRYSELPQIGPLQGQGAETSSKGAKIVRFSPTDPDDIATVITQAMGFTPTKVAREWELRRDVRDTLQVYNAQRLALYAQMDKAIQSRDNSVINDVRNAIVQYNKEVGKVDPNMSINITELTKGLMARIKSRMFTEATGAPDKRELLIRNRMKDLYPGIQESGALIDQRTVK